MNRLFHVNFVAKETSTGLTLVDLLEVYTPDEDSARAATVEKIKSDYPESELTVTVTSVVDPTAWSRAK